MTLIKIPEANLNYSCEIIEHIFTCEKRSKIVKIKDVHNFFNKTKHYTDSAISFLLFLEILTQDGQKLKIENDTYKKLNGSREKTVILFKNKITRFKPYIEYNYFLSIGKSSNESAKLVKYIYTLDKNEDKIIKIFDYWSKFLNIEHDKKPTEYSNEIEQLNSSLNNQILIQKFLKEQFEEYYKDISNNVIDDLIEALTDYKKDPSKSINDAGRALEDFLRIDLVKSVDLTNCSGIIQISNELNRHTISTKKHNGLIAGLGHIRSMGDAHGADRLHGERWGINENSALFYVIIVIKTINSLFEYQKNEKLIF